MKLLTSKSGYQLNSQTNIWLRPDYLGIAYSDGNEVEQRIAAIIEQASDITVLSTVLRQHCTDWPSLYHLTSARANILRPFEPDLRGNILEIGAGCGAITRYLGECGGKVLALEGSPRRAAIARSRTRDLPNVTVVSDKFDQFQSDQKFHVITLIGVLEYANLFTGGETPALSMLQRIQSMLKPDGKLIIAIENQLGLKYFAGAPEDHLGQAMYGIEGRYRKDQPQTYGRKTLTEMLRQAGFAYSDFMAAFPDYKLPASIVTESGFLDEGFDASALAWQSVRRDSQLPHFLAFSPELVWPTVVQNGVALDLANSFLIVAGASIAQRPPLSHILAWHFTSERSKEFCKETRFLRTDNGSIEVQYHLLAPGSTKHADGRLLKFFVPEKAEYVHGRPLSQELIHIVTRDGWRIEEVGTFLLRYLHILGSIASTHDVPLQIDSADTPLPGEFFDLLPQNIIVGHDGSWQVIDKEWTLNDDIAAGRLVFRSLLSLIDTVTRFGAAASDFVNTPLGFFHAAFKAIGFAVTDAEIESYVKLEIELQAEVAQRPMTSDELLNWLRTASLPRQNLNQAVAERDGQIGSLNQSVTEVSVWAQSLQAGIEERDGQIGSLNQSVTEVSVWAQSLQAGIDERDGQIGSLNAERDNAMALANLMRYSTSWRLTRPLRFVARLARYGLTNEDRQALRQRYHRLPLPALAKRLVSFFYHKIVGKAARAIRRSALHTPQFQPPSIESPEKPDSAPDYIVWGVIDWHFRHQRPQQLAVALTNTGRRVFYITPNFTDDEREGFELEALDDTGLLFQVKLFVKGAPVIYSSAPGVETIAQLRASIGELLEWADGKQIISMVDHPYWHDVASVLPNCRLIYDCMDHHEGFGNNAESLMQLEKSLLSIADLTITTSSWLDSAVAPHARRRALIRNAGDYDHFCRAPDSVYRDPQGRRIIGYYGAIAEWFDLDLIEAVAKQHPECCVLLIGADTVNAKARLAKLPNVTFTGEVSYSQLPHYLYGFDVCLLPFKVIPLTLATNPVKAYEYLSAGKPVVAVDLPEMTQFEGLVYAAADKDAFLAAVSKVLSQPEPDALVQQRKAFTQGQTWRHRAEVLIEYAESAAHDPKISVVVVTYNNQEFTRACLASLDDYSQYENIEIIVIDNASSDGSPAFLAEWASGKENRKLILNEDNRGFAAANNQGLEIATGDYLVMLNNDTYVTPGWVRTLVRHLERDKTIGLIGPVTNNIGNEAKIDITYGSMDEMLLKSAAFTRRHVGLAFPLRTAAFFCVMMPRTTYSRVGTLDEVFGRGFFEDDDYCRRIEQLGLRVVCAEDVFVHHHLSASFNKLKSKDRQKLFEDNKATYEAKWGEWVPHSYGKTTPAPAPYPFETSQHLTGRFNVCGNSTRFFYTEVALWRESLNCEHCRTTSRYRSITTGILRALDERAGVQADSLTSLPRSGASHRLRVYDTQPPFYYDPCAYPLPDLLKATGWIDVELSQYKPKRPMGERISKGVTNQNLECLTFDDESLDIVITSDVMEHVRLDDRAHNEIYRVLKPGGIYIFTVTHNRAWDETLVRVQIADPDDPSKDVHLLEPEYHGDTNSDEGGGVLAYRTYGRDIESFLQQVGFEVEYFREEIKDMGIMNTELYYCRKAT